MSEPTILTPPSPDNTGSDAPGIGTPPAPSTPPAETPPATQPNTPPAPPETPPETPPAGAPEKYTDFTMPEGVALDKDLLGEADPLFREANLTQEIAQKFVDLQTRAAQKWADGQVQEHQALVAFWSEEAKKDPEFGGQTFDLNIATAIKALNQFGTPAFRELLDITGLCNHPEMVRFCFKIGKTIAEPGLVDGERPGIVQDTAKILFPTMK